MKSNRNNAQNRAIDGFINAPKRASSADSLGGRLISADRNHKSERMVDDFNRPEGYNLAYPNISQSTDQPKIATKTTKPEKKVKTRRSRRSVSKWFLWSGLAIFGILAIIGGFLLIKGYIKVHKVFKGGGGAASLHANVNPELLRGEGDGRVNILLLGKGGPGHDGPDLTDTILVMSIDPVNKKAALVSIPRDLWVSVPGYGSQKINSVYANAKYHALAVNPKDKAGAEKVGISLAEQTASQVLGVPIHYYGMLDFEAFRKAVDTVGGVTIDVPEDLIDSTMAWENNGSPVLARKGQQTFNGTKALMYVRSRHGSLRGDFDRTDRQRLFITALMQKVLSVGTYSNPVKVSNLLSAFGDHIQTDVSVNDALRMAKILKEVGNQNIKSVNLAGPPTSYVKTGNIGGQSIVLPIAGLGNYDPIHSFIRNELKDGYIAKENANIMILNGTNIAGLGSQKAEILKSYGYNVGTVGTAPTTNYTKTIIVDLNGGQKPYTLHYLEKRFGVTAVRKLPDNTIKPNGANFVIILGQE